MIEINLLPGAKKAKKAGGGLSAPNFGAALSGLGASVKDPFLAFAVVALLIGVLGTAYQVVTLQTRGTGLTEREQVAIQDSTRYAAVLRERIAVTARRDSIQRQLVIIQAIDGDRFVWPHLLDEIAELLPPYTWLTTVAQTSAVPSIMARDAQQAPPDTTAAAVPPPEPLAFRIVGQTVDIQALTRYMRMLEASPFIEGVALVRSDLTNVQNRQVTEFTLDLRYQKPDSAYIRTEPLTVAVR
jgi:Tfp pilus assembly protein PilN